LVAIADQHRLQVRVADPEVADLDLDVVAEAARQASVTSAVLDVRAER
jgi:hypothetical protein